MSDICVYFESVKFNLEFLSYFFQSHFKIFVLSVCMSTTSSFSLRFFFQELISFLFSLVVFICMENFFLFKNANILRKESLILIRQLLKFVDLTTKLSNLRNKIIKWTQPNTILVYLLHVEKPNCLKKQCATLRHFLRWILEILHTFK
jgi:predicted class III extradiol MEMO1 family dioxygenase